MIINNRSLCWNFISLSLYLCTYDCIFCAFFYMHVGYYNKIELVMAVQLSEDQKNILKQLEELEKDFQYQPIS